MHDLYGSQEISYPVNKLISQQLYHPSIKVKLTAFNRSCPQSCQQRELTLDTRFKMHSPEGLGGSLHLRLIKDIPSRTNSVVVDMMGAYWVILVDE